MDGENANAASLFIKRLTRFAPHRGALNGPAPAAAARYLFRNARFRPIKPAN